MMKRARIPWEVLALVFFNSSGPSQPSRQAFLFIFHIMRRAPGIFPDDVYHKVIIEEEGRQMQGEGRGRGKIGGWGGIGDGIEWGMGKGGKEKGKGKVIDDLVIKTLPGEK